MALKFAKAYPVVLLARNPANYEDIVKEIKASGGQAIGFPTDVASQSSVKEAFVNIKKEFGGKKLAAAIFNVGGSFIRKPFLELTAEEYELGYSANGYVDCHYIQAFGPIGIYSLVLDSETVLKLS